jgi:Ca-activated chloride channel family protein
MHITRGGGGRHRAPRRRRRPSRAVVITVAAVVVALLLGIGGWFVFLRGDAAPAEATCEPTRVALNVVASPEVAPVLTQAAASFDSGTNSSVGGKCARTTVSAAAPSAFGDTLGAALQANGGSGAPTAWVPTASTWRGVLSRRPELSAALPRAFPVVALSPVVMAAPRPMAEALGWPKNEPSWSELTGLTRDARGWGARGHSEWGPVRMAWRDPLGNAASLAATTSIYDAVVQNPGSVDDVRRDLLSAQSALATLGADPAKTLAPLRNAEITTAEALRQTPMLPMTEREVMDFNRDSPRVPLAALYLSDGVPPAEVPLITLNASWVTADQRALLDKFAEFLVTGNTAKQFAADGWRTPRLVSEGGETLGALWDEPEYTPPSPDIDKVATVLQAWSALDRQGSVFVVLDTSGSMNEKVPSAGNATRLDLAKQAITSSLPLFSDRTAVALWTFSRKDSGADWTSVSDFGPLSRQVGATTARDALKNSVNALKADGATGLYDTVIAAVDAARKNWREGNNTVILISDGKNEDAGSASLDTAVARAKALADPKRPIRILSIALGDQADAAALAKIASATNGESFVARNAADLDSVFLAALTE